MSYLIICIVALATALLTLFSGFGLGTLLMPAFALFFPIQIAVASTAVVHGANNLFKVALLYKHINKSVLVHFGFPAMISAMAGAYILNRLSDISDDFKWSLLSLEFETTGLKLVMGLLILSFALIDWIPTIKNTTFSPKWLSLGGVLSGFFGGLSGHQGAFRSMFLLKCNLNPKQFVATQSIIAALVDISRLFVYSIAFLSLTESYQSEMNIDWSLVAWATVCAFIGTYFGKKLLDKTKIESVRWIVFILLLTVAIAMITGLI